MRRLLSLILVSVTVAEYCNPGEVYSATFNKCYHFVEDSVTFLAAEATCQNNEGHLVSISSELENQFVAENAEKYFNGNLSSSFWIGLNEISNAGNWTWTDGSSARYLNWYYQRPSEGQCGTFLHEEGYWIAENCAVRKPFVCARLLQTTSTPLIQTTCPTQQACEGTCLSGWTYYSLTDSCYKTFFNDKWADAEAVCVTQGAHLASIHSQQENTFVNNMARTGIKDGDREHLAWIGMQKVNSVWVWTDGTATDYFNWAKGQPNNPTTELCVQTAPDLSHKGWYEEWNDFKCSSDMRSYVCKMPSTH